MPKMTTIDRLFMIANGIFTLIFFIYGVILASDKDYARATYYISLSIFCKLTVLAYNLYEKKL